MNKTNFLLISLLLLNFSSFAGVITIDGTFQGKNLLVQNPFASSGVGFCTYEVTINGKTTTDEVNSSAFEIDFSNFQLALGAKVEVKIKHKDDCKPRVINPEVLRSMSTFEINLIKIEKDGNLNFSTKNESGKLPFEIEQFRWNKWVKVGEVEGKGSATDNQYSFKLPNLHSGENRFRLKQIDATGKPRTSAETKHKSTAPPVTWQPGEGKPVKGEIKFSATTMYEVYDAFGNIVDKGISDRIDINKLGKGSYQFNYDNSFGQFKK